MNIISHFFTNDDSFYSFLFCYREKEDEPGSNFFRQFLELLFSKNVDSFVINHYHETAVDTAERRGIEQLRTELVNLKLKDAQKRKLWGQTLSTELAKMHVYSKEQAKQIISVLLKLRLPEISHLLENGELLREKTNQVISTLEQTKQLMKDGDLESAVALLIEKNEQVTKKSVADAVKTIEDRFTYSKVRDQVTAKHARFVTRILTASTVKIEKIFTY